MKERPILFSAPMVRALLASTKTQTRRVLRDQNPVDLGAFTNGDHLSRRPVFDKVAQAVVGHRMAPVFCPYGQPGDRLWVRESLRQWSEDRALMAFAADDRRLGEFHEVDWPSRCGEKVWKAVPSIHLPRAWSRITLEVTAVRVERLQCISEVDAVAEGVFRKVGRTSIGDIVATAEGAEVIYAFPTQAREHYRRLWESINGPGSWAANPLVWAVSFKKVTS